MPKKRVIIFITVSVFLFLVAGGPQWLIQQYVFSKVDETDTHLFYVLKKYEKPYIVRCEKGVKERLSNYHLYNKRVRVISNLLSSQDDLPSGEESRELNPLEERIVNAVIANNEKEFVLGGYVEGGGKKEVFLYANNLMELNKVFKGIQNELSTHTLKLDVQDDKNWDYYNAFCVNRQLPSTY